MKRSFRWIAMLLIAVMTFTAPAEVFAAETKGKYVSELVMADSAEALVKAGCFAVENGNLNDTLPTGVYLGYKTTDDPEEAIRDAAAMNMTGKYSYGDYKAIMAAHEEKVRNVIENFLPSLEEFQTNYDAELPRAMVAYASLNTYQNTDTGEAMGDYFVNYDFKQTSEKELTETLMRANTESVLAMMTSIAMGADSGEDTLIDRLIYVDENGVESLFEGASLTRAKARQALASAYGETAEEILTVWNDLYEYLLDVEEDLIVSDDAGRMVGINQEATNTALGIDTSALKGDEKEYADTVIGVTELMSDTDKLVAMNLYGMLSETEYDGGTLLDFFMRPAKEVDEEELYPLASVMSEGQRSQVTLLGLKTILLGGSIDLEEGSAEAEDAVTEAENTAESMGPFSIFEGVDRSVFDEGVAFTDAATVHEAQTGESWLGKFGAMMTDADYWSPTAIASWAVTGVSLIGCIAGSAVYRNLGKKIEKLSDYNDYAHEKYEELLTEADFYDHRLEPLEVPEDLIQEYQIWKNEKDIAENNYNAFTAKYAGVRYNSGLAAGICFVLFIVAVAVDVYTIVDYFGRQEPTEEMIPHHIMTAAETEYGEDYVYYEAVKDLNGDAADMNRHEGDKSVGWLVLYTTKEKAAGKPMLARDLRVVKGKDKVSTETSFVHLFNETAALDVTSELYTGKANAGGETYILFDRDLSTLAGSAVSGGVAAIIAVGGALIGFAGGFGLNALRNKKKRSPAKQGA